MGFKQIKLGICYSFVGMFWQLSFLSKLNIMPCSIHSVASMMFCNVNHFLTASKDISLPFLSCNFQPQYTVLTPNGNYDKYSPGFGWYLKSTIMALWNSDYETVVYCIISCTYNRRSTACDIRLSQLLASSFTVLQASTIWPVTSSG